MVTLQLVLLALSTRLCISTNETLPESQIATRTLLTDAVNTIGAQCIDGTPAAYFFSSGKQSTKYVIYFEGGGWCGCITRSCSTGFDTCLQRSMDYLGSSSTKYSQNTQTLDLNAYPAQMLSSNQSLNPMMYDWNHIFVHYCDGGSFGGNLENPIEVNGKKLYFRGFRILNAVFQDLQKNHGLETATDFVISGGSAGGLTTYLHTNYIYDTYLNHVSNVYSLPDCGFFMDSNGVNGVTNYSNAMKWVYKEQNITSDKYCLEWTEKNQKNDDLCIFAANVAPWIKVPLFALQSQYDMWQIPNILGTTNVTYIDWYGQNLTAFIQAFVMNSDTNRYSGSFLSSCYSHCGLWDEVHIDNQLEDNAFTLFYENKNNSEFYFQNNTYPCATCCS
eukprot:277596_1